ncbi:MAG: hypothetical protein COU08_01840 [Candidatus Harrisonbacteria bacterium CG10_big_fil_rev_8_21_14_0_10_42_17]|uniref:PDZ domain-containing protein n=1 Tax=Candidatus Harrisonbacteria bacterium CG10_big_fil_rev_8_21_14_0_10_42_17 TaxID=1974584 RepID=A0A2M6WIB0_9BACT|nr:MAG: hypothetical protein COU08_01840 [Candidatus Harrisonbacteria bacterium CG10_big_fil_rev_8_21_14_0_10_42_17]
MRATTFFLLGLMITIVVGSLVVGFIPNNNGQASIQSFFQQLIGIKSIETITEQSESAQPYEAPLAYEDAIIKAVEENAEAVITIIITKDLPILERCSTDPFSDLPSEFRDFFGPFQFFGDCETGTTRKEEVGGGSGFVITKEGMILTNKHVVEDEDAEYTILTNDGKRFEAEILARDPLQDLALIKFKNPPEHLKTVTLGNSDSIKLGQTAIAIGNALGEFRNTVSAGVVSGLARNITAGGRGTFERIEGLIQTDAAINPGNSGGPLLNLRGEVIGINTAIAQNAENIGFAIPINKAKRDITSFNEAGEIVFPYLGVRYTLITEEIAKKEKLPVTKGAIVQSNGSDPSVLKGSPAEKAGIKDGDIITKINNNEVTEEHSLATIVQQYRTGDVISIQLLRDDKKITLFVTLEKREF